MIVLAPDLTRLRSRRHLDRIKTLRCCVPGCRGWPVDPHHLLFVQPRAMSLKVGDQNVVPLCRWTHHLASSRAGVHATGDERAWWAARGIDPIALAARLWGRE